MGQPGARKKQNYSGPTETLALFCLRSALLFGYHYDIDGDSQIITEFKRNGMCSDLLDVFGQMYNLIGNFKSLLAQ